MKTLTEYPLTELKLIYAILHMQIAEQPDLMDSHLLHDIQTLLQQKATEDGVDVSTHAEWAAWLNNTTDQVRG